MKVLMLSSDKRVLENGSDVWRRMRDYESLTDNLEIMFVTKNNYLKNFFHKTKIKPDVVTTQDPFELGFLGWFMARKFKAGLQLQIHTDFLSPHFKKESLKNRIRILIAKFLLPKADCVRVVSERIALSLKRGNWKLKAEPVVLPIFVDIPKIKEAPIVIDLHKKYPQFEKIVLMVSRLTKEKNVELGIKVFQQVLRDYPKTGLVIIGDGPDSKKLMKLALRLCSVQAKLKAIIIEPWTNELASYYKTANCLLLTSNYEGYGLTFVEAAAAGCPIVATNVGIAREVTDYVCEVGDMECLSENLVKVLSGDYKPPRLPELPTKEEYLDGYKKSWEICVS